MKWALSALLLAAVLFVVVQTVVLPRVHDGVCGEAWLALDHTKNPTITELGFTLRCETLSLGAARCTNTSVASASSCDAHQAELSQTFLIPIHVR